MTESWEASLDPDGCVNELSIDESYTAAEVHGAKNSAYGTTMQEEAKE